MKCPICGKRYRGELRTITSGRCEHYVKDYIKEVERLKKLLKHEKDSRRRTEIMRKRGM